MTALLIYGVISKLQILTKSFFSIVFFKTPPQALDNTSFIQYKPFKGGLPYLLSQKMAAELMV